MTKIDAKVFSILATQKKKKKRKKRKRSLWRTTVAYGESVKCKFFRRAGFYQRLYARAWGLKRPRNGDLITRSRYLYNLGNSISPGKKGDFDERTLSPVSRKFRTARCDLRRGTITTPMCMHASSKTMFG